MTFVYYVGADLHTLVNSNTITQYSSCIVTKMLVKSICLGVQHRQLNYLPVISTSRCINNNSYYADSANA